MGGGPDGGAVVPSGQSLNETMRAIPMVERGAAGKRGGGGSEELGGRGGARSRSRGLRGLVSCDECWFLHLCGCIRNENPGGYRPPPVLRTAYCAELFRLGCEEASDAYLPPSVRAARGGPEATFLGDFAAGPKCYCLRRGGDIIVSFGGTANLADLQSDLRVTLKRTSYLPRGCKVHEGFDAQYSIVRHQIRERIRDLAPLSAERLVCVGHSLGGALATLCALDLRLREAGLRTVCLTYGCPRVGNASFAYHFNRTVDESYRFVNKRDLFPHTPSRWRYRHVRGLLVFRPDGTVGSGDRMPRFVFHNLMDHGMPAYRRNFETCLHRGDGSLTLRPGAHVPQGPVRRCVQGCLAWLFCSAMPGCYFCALDHFGADEGSAVELEPHSLSHIFSKSWLGGRVGRSKNLAPDREAAGLATDEKT